MVRRAGSAWMDYPDLSTLVVAQDYKDYSDALDSVVGAGRTGALTCEVAQSVTLDNLASDDYSAGDGWSTTIDPDGMFSPAAAAPCYITAPIAGRYWLFHQLAANAASTGTAPTAYSAKIILNGTVTGDTTDIVFADSIASGYNAEGTPYALTTQVLAAGDKLRWTAWANGTFQWVPSRFGNVRSRMVARWVGPN